MAISKPSNFRDVGIDFDNRFIRYSDVGMDGPAGLWAWGWNYYGGLGTGDIVHRSSPVQVGSLTTWSLVACGHYHTIATKTDGTLWAWGYNSIGALGQGNTTNYSSPVQVGTLTTWSTWSKIACGYEHTLATKTDGTLWAWGYDAYGQLGQGNTTNYSSPVQVGSLTTWSQIAGGQNHTIATKTDGTLWAWGYNAQGQLGKGNTTNYSSPVQVGSLTTWSLVACGAYHTIATKTNGTLWAWGGNQYGQLGQGDSYINYSSPVQVGTLTTWSKIAGCGNGHTLATKTDGTLWAWGRNAYGQLGQGNITNYSSPVQVGTLTTWSKIAGCGNGHTLATKTDGTLWACGYNNYGQLGQGNTTWYSSPVQVGSLTTWSKIAGGGYNTIARTF